MNIIQEELICVHKKVIKIYTKLMNQYKSSNYSKNKKQNESENLNTITTSTPMDTHGHYGYYSCVDLSNRIKNLKTNIDKQFKIIKDKDFDYLSTNKSEKDFLFFLENKKPESYKFVINSLTKTFNNDPKLFLQIEDEMRRMNRLFLDMNPDDQII